MLRELRAAILPAQRLTKTIASWNELPSALRNPNGPGSDKSLSKRLRGLAHLKLEARGTWKPADHHYWGDEGLPIEDWAKPIIAWGSRPEFEMEQVLPGADAEDPFPDPIIESNDRKDGGDIESANKILMDLCQADLRCLDAHAHLGNIAFDHWPEIAIRHYEVGLRIGELSFGESFDGLLPGGGSTTGHFSAALMDLGCAFGGQADFEEAENIFKRMLWQNPSDNQGVRFLIEHVRAGAAWQSSNTG